MGIRTVSIGPLRDIVCYEDGDTFEDGTPVRGISSDGAVVTGSGAIGGPVAGEATSGDTLTSRSFQRTPTFGGFHGFA